MREYASCLVLMRSFHGALFFMRVYEARPYASGFGHYVPVSSSFLAHKVENAILRVTTLYVLGAACSSSAAVSAAQVRRARELPTLCR